MPSAQRGTLAKRDDRWSARWRDAERQATAADLRRRPRRQGGGAGVPRADPAQGRGAAASDPIAQRRQDLPTLGALVAEYLEQHNAEANKRSARSPLASGTRPKGRSSTARAAGARRPGSTDWRSARDRRLAGKRLPERSAWAIHKAATAGARLRGQGEARRRERRDARPEPGAETARGADLRDRRRAGGGRRRAGARPSTVRCRCSSASPASALRSGSGSSGRDVDRRGLA